jgi:ABC-2 type transport system ATP-binding protein
VVVTTHHLDEASQCDRLIIMTAGRVVAAGPEHTIVGARTAVEVQPVAGTEWVTLFDALTAAGLPVSLHGRALRVPGTDVARVHTLLEAAHLFASLASVPATLEETFVELASAHSVVAP